MDKFNHVKTFHEFDNDIPHLEGRIPLLDKSMESPSDALSTPHEVQTTSPYQEDTLSEVIERIGRINIDVAPSQLIENLGPSQNGPPKCLTKTIESSHPNEARKKETRSATKQNVADVDDLDSTNDMDVFMIMN